MGQALSRTKCCDCTYDHHLEANLAHSKSIGYYRKSDLKYEILNTEPAIHPSLQH